MIETFYAEVNSYIGLRDAFRARVEQLNISRENLDEVTGMAAGYCGKLLATGEAKDPKRIGPMSLDAILPAIGLKLVLVDDRRALDKYSAWYVPRETKAVRLNNDCRRAKGRRKQKPAQKPRKAAAVKRGKPFLSR